LEILRLNPKIPKFCNFGNFEIKNPKIPKFCNFGNFEIFQNFVILEILRLKIQKFQNFVILEILRFMNCAMLKAHFPFLLLGVGGGRSDTDRLVLLSSYF